MREAQEKIRATATEKIAKVLTKDQSAAFDKMLGKPFDLSKLRPGPGPGRGPGPGGPPPDGAPAAPDNRRGASR
jgi:hypothetical protein